ncbi:hypothetical protein DV736_g5210, partial [Chaetothyriales sp. CBS 134916]
MPEPCKRARLGHPEDKSGSEHHHQPKKQKKDPARAKYRAQAAAQTRTLPHDTGGTTISTTSWPRHRKRAFLNEAIQAGDVGIFVTSDRGKERAALREADDLISHYLERHQVPGEQREHGKAGAATDVDDDVTDTASDANAKANLLVDTKPTEIEDQIAAELAELDDDGSRAGPSNTSSSNLSKLDLITLDIPCVSFILNRGLDDLCAEILPVHFATDHLSREATIAATAGWVQKQRLDRGSPGTTAALGHKVDLKHWDKLIVVEAYRGLIGMSVIDVGYQEWDGPLKRGNLAEVYAAAATAQ